MFRRTGGNPQSETDEECFLLWDRAQLKRIESLLLEMILPIYPIPVLPAWNFEVLLTHQLNLPAHPVGYLVITSAGRSSFLSLPIDMTSTSRPIWSSWVSINLIVDRLSTPQHAILLPLHNRWLKLGLVSSWWIENTNYIKLLKPTYLVLFCIYVHGT